MKNLLLAGVLLLPFVASASQLCSTQTDWSFLTWSGAGFSCEADDLVFSSFSVNNVPGNMALNFSTNASGSMISLNLVNGTFARALVLATKSRSTTLRLRRITNPYGSSIRPLPRIKP
jgi:hypothetical protein